MYIHTLCTDDEKVMNIALEINLMIIKTQLADKSTHI